MNDPNRPLSPETLDELVSADIDGELDRAATELGLTHEDARAAIKAAPDALTRRRSLEAARDLFSTQPNLDPATSSQLVASALAAAAPTAVPMIRSHRRRTAWRALVGAAAAAAVVAGIVAVAATNPGSESKSSLSSGSASTKKTGASDAPLRYLPAYGSVAFGDVSQARSLRARASYELGSLRDAPLPAAAAVVPSDATHNRLELPAAGPGEATFNSGVSKTPTKAEFAASQAALRACISKVATARHLRVAPLLSGTGTSHSRPVYVVVFREAGTKVAYVLAAADCSVVARETLP